MMDDCVLENNIILMMITNYTKDFLEENAACFYFKQLVQVVIGCSSQGVIHR